MAHTHEFDCRQCGAHLDSREALDKHNRENHSRNAQAGGDATERDTARGDSTSTDNTRSDRGKNDQSIL
jgi:hypothetical protein